MSPRPLLPTTRREFLNVSGKGVGLLAFGRFAPEFLVQSTRAAVAVPEKDRSILVVVQLAGGNDGLNTLVPFEDSHYYRLRPTLALPADKVLRIGDGFGLHPACAALHGLHQDGKVAIIQNVGYPNPNRSHFRSTEIWETATASDAASATGWIGRYLDHTCAGTPRASADPVAVHVTGTGVPQAFMSEGVHPTFGLSTSGGSRRDNEASRHLLERLLDQGGSGNPAGGATPGTGSAGFLQQTLMDTLVTERKVQRLLAGYRPEVRYPATQFGGALRSVAALIAAGLPTRVYYVSLGGFDTHSGQLNQHAMLLTQLSDGLGAFQRDLASKKLEEQVLTMTFSEFGRRPMENQSRGTDHGTAAPLFVLGAGVQAGLHGTPPSLALEPNQDLTFSTDFRRVYATAVAGWLGGSAEKILDGTFAPLAFLRNPS